MPRRLFKRFAIKRHEFRSNNVLLRPFRKIMDEPRYWGTRRRTVAPAFALGLFLSFLPLVGQPIIGTFIAMAARINIPIAFVTPLVIGLPLTPVFYYSSYWLGSWLLSLPSQPFAYEWSWDWLSSTFVSLWQPMLLGGLVLGAAAALLGYVIVDVMWRLSIWEYKRVKRRIRHSRNDI
ncbi:MAG: DUF2062 domain-containing protein [Woeseiaceae bacterium]|nr:DUF2062 domain-containing protein [Woeseiaceae bacterium]